MTIVPLFFLPKQLRIDSPFVLFFSYSRDKEMRQWLKTTSLISVFLYNVKLPTLNNLVAYASNKTLKIIRSALALRTSIVFLFQCLAVGLIDIHIVLKVFLFFL